MTEPSSNENDSVALSVLEKVHAACVEFEAACRMETTSSIERYLAGWTGPERAVLLRELLALELDYRRNRGDTPGLDEYLRRFPSDESVIRAVFVMQADPNSPSDDRAGAARPRPNGGPPSPPADHAAWVAPGKGSLASTDRNLLFGVLALQADLIDARQFVEACGAWAARKDARLADILVQHGWISPRDREDIDRLLERKLLKYGGDVHKTLGAIVDANARDAIRSIADPEIQQSVSSLPPATGHVLLSTVNLRAEDRSRYTLTRLHKEGGLGRVWLARDGELNREVALKEIKPRYAEHPEAWRRFLKEAQITGQLEHPNIVPVYELGQGQTKDTPFYTMRFVRGQTLREAITEYHEGQSKGNTDRLGLQRLLGAFVNVCHAIGYAHARGVVHRDIKPENVVLGEFGSVVVLDWGLAKLVGRPEEEDEWSSIALGDDAKATATAAGAHLGTPAYMAPEQAEGKIGQIDSRTDIYGLGAILFTLLTGQPPHKGHDTQEILKHVRDHPTPRARQLEPSVSPPLDAICAKAMASSRSDRYGKASELADDVQRWLADEAVSAYRGVRYRARLWLRRHRNSVAATLAVAILFAAGLTSWIVTHSMRLNAMRRQVTERSVAGDAAARAGNLEQAMQYLSEAVALGDHAAALRPVRDAAARQRDQLAQYSTFQRRAKEALRTGIHAFGPKERIAFVTDPNRADTVAERYREALSIYRVLDDERWEAELALAPLSPPQIAAVKKDAADLLLGLAIRLALYDTKDENSRNAAREALTLLDRASRLEEPSQGVWLLRMLWNRRLGNDQAADEAGQKTSETTPQSADDHYLLGSISLQVRKDPAAAVKHYGQALVMNPTHYGAHFGLFLCYQDLKDARRELVPLSACLALSPDDPYLYYFRGMAYFELGPEDTQYYEFAYRDFDASVARDPKYAMGYFYRGRMSVVRGDWEAAEKDFAQAIEIDPTYTQVFMWRAVARAKINRHAEAAGDAEELVNREPDDNFSLFFAARAYAQCVQAAKETPQGAEGDELAKRYADRSMALLHKAIEHGFKDFSRLLPGSDFTPVRDHPDFPHEKVGIPRVSSAADLQKLLASTDALANDGRHQELARIAEQLRELLPEHPTNLYNVACCYALASSAAARGKQELSEVEQLHQRLYSEKAVTALQQAVAAGYKEFDHMRGDSDLESIRDHPVYQQLLKAGTARPK